MINTFKSVLMFLLFCSMGLYTSLAQSSQSDSLAEIKAMQKFIDSLKTIDKTIAYQTGNVSLNAGIELAIPEAYKFVPKENAQMIVSDLWGNPKDNSVMGMIVHKDFSIIDFDAWAFIVSYEESGYIKDEDAKEIDYDKMLKEMQESEAEVNKERLQNGYPSIHFLNWAVKPFYDDEKKILHWAKKLQFGDEAMDPNELTLNYDVRILGRKGVLSLNAVGSMDQLDDINQHIADVLNIATFKEGYAYSDFNPSVDKVAAYTVGGLIAGKLIAKTGILVLILKNIKLVIFALVGFIGVFRKRIARLFSKNKHEDDFSADINDVASDNAHYITTVDDTTNDNMSIPNEDDSNDDVNNKKE